MSDIVSYFCLILVNLISLGSFVLSERDQDDEISLARLEFQRSIQRIQRNMVALYPKYCLSEKLKKQLQNLDAQEEEKTNMRAEVLRAYLEVATNVTSYCRSLVSNSGMQQAGKVRGDESERRAKCY